MHTHTTVWLLKNYSQCILTYNTRILLLDRTYGRTVIFMLPTGVINHAPAPVIGVLGACIRLLWRTARPSIPNPYRVHYYRGLEPLNQSHTHTHTHTHTTCPVSNQGWTWFAFLKPNPTQNFCNQPNPSHRSFYLTQANPSSTLGN